MWIGRLRWWRAVLLGILALLGVGLALSWVVVRVYGPAFTRERVEAALTEALGQPAHVGAVRLTPWRARLSLVGLDVPAVPPDGILLRAAIIDVSVDIASLWRREITVSAVATDLHLDMAVPRTEATGPAVFPLPRYIAIGPLRVAIGSVRVKGGHVTLREPEAALTLVARGADVTAWPVDRDLDVSGRLDMLRVDALGRGEQIEQLALDGRLSADAIRIRRINWRWQGDAMQLDGELRHPWVPGREVSLRLKGDIALGALARAFGLDDRDRVDGKAQVDAEVAGAVTSPRIAGGLRIPELRLAGVAARDVSINGQWGDRALRLDDIRARLGAGHLRARLDVTQVSGRGAGVALDVRELVLPGALAALGAGTGMAQGTIREATLDLRRAEFAWPGLAATLDGHLTAGPPLALRGKLTADLGALGRVLHWAPLSGRASISAELTGRGATPAVEGRAEIADLVAAGHTVEPIESSFRIAASSGPDPRWAGTVELPRVRWDQFAVDGLTASLAVDGTKVEVIRARARVAAAPVEATAVWHWAGSGRGHATFGPVALASISGVSPALRLGGMGRATANASVDRGVTSASATIDLEQVSAAGVSLGAGRTELRLRDQALDGELSFPARRLRARAAGRLGAGGTLTSSLELDDLALQPLLRELGSGAAAIVDGRVSSRAELSIPLGQPEARHGIVRLMPDGLRLFGEPWASRGPIVLRVQGSRLTVEHLRLDGPAGSLSATGSLAGPDNGGLALAIDNARLPGALAQIGRGTVRSDVRLGGGLELTRLDARWPGLTAAASGRARADGAVELSGRVDADLAGLGPALGISGMAGRAALTAEARGRSDAIETAGVIRAARIQVGNAVVADIEVPFRVSPSSARVERAQARLGTGRITADVSAAWKGTGSLTAESLARDTQVKAEVRAPALRLEDLASLLPAALEGRGGLAVTARAEGTPRAWRGTGTLTSPLVEVGAGPLRQLRAAFAVDQTRIEVTDLHVDALGVPARGMGDWAWAGGGSAKATLGPASLAGLAGVPAGVGLRGTGRATIDVAMRSPADVSGTAHADLQDVAAGSVSLGRGLIDVSARDGAFRAEVAFPEPGLRASGTGRVDPGGTLTAEATAPGIDLAPFARALEVPGGLGATLSARATARVPLAEPRRGEGVLSIDPVRLTVAKEVWESRGPIEARWAQGGISLASFRLAGKDGQLSGAGTLAADGKLDARVSAQVPLAMLEAMRPEVRESGGVLDLSLRVTGSASTPSFSGEGAIHRGSLLLRDRPETLRDLEALVSLTSQGIHLRDATGSIGGGRVQARGDLALRGWQPGSYRLRLQAREVAVASVDGFSSAWDADLELSGLTQEAQLQGRARLVRGVYSRDLSILGLALSPSPAPAAPTGPRLRLSVRVDLDDNLVVRNRIADLRAGGVLRVEGTTAHPVIFGSLESRDGRIVFRGRDWSVTTAAVRFADPRQLDPYLDVLATSRIGEYEVTMQISGPVSNVAVRFSSTPRLSQNDLLSLVAFGVTGADLRESPATVLLGEAGKMLAKNVLGIETGASGLRISTGSSSGTSSELRGFPGEERPTVGPSQNTPGGRKEKVRVEYQLLAPLFLSGEYDRDGSYGADVVLRFRFR